MSSFLIRSPSDLRVQVGLIEPTNVEPVVTLSTFAFREWSATPYEQREAALDRIEADIRDNAEALASAITLEVGKTIRESREELAAIPHLFAQTKEDARAYHFEAPFAVGPEGGSEIRRTPRGPVAVIGPFNFPILQTLRTALPYLLAGNTVVFKSSPMSAVISAKLTTLMQKHLPEGVMTLVQGGAEERIELCKDERIRSISFSGNLLAAREVVNSVALDFSKTLAIETGGKNAVILLEDGDPVEAAKAAAYGMCSLVGQRGDSTSRAIVHESKIDTFNAALVEALDGYAPGNPASETTTLGVLVNEAAHKRYAEVLDAKAGVWLQRGDAMYQNEGCPGYFVKPAVRLWPSYESGILCPIINNEIYAPIIDVFSVSDDREIISLNNATTYGNTASLFTASKERFETIGRELRIGNLYANLPTLNNHAWLPACGRRNSNNGKSFGRGFIRHTANELAVMTQGLS